ncbi:MAG: tRNA (adenosine(37)-N6)-threonylcarbamoyltransferase complex ATPase subunit type 1 TsaE [Chloroflexi bacterium]|nr:tRNA (adenosine(37)-N6)-threonylcarbamoyltransferase complex ATPase subunit type 1 TsaE [Chloroflexota bacterium]
MWTFTSNNAEHTHQFGAILGRLLRPDHIVCLSGDLGTGKTTLVRGIGEGWGSVDRITSPTFTLVNVYQRAADDAVLYHLDTYRLETPQAIWSVGLDDLLAGRGSVVIEWADRIRSELPAEHLWIDIQYHDVGPDQRLFQLHSSDTYHQALLAALRIQVERVC